MKKENKNNKTMFFTIYIAIICILLGIGFYGFFSTLNRDTIYENIKIDEFNVSDMSKKEALIFLKENLNGELSNKQMNLSYKDFVYNVGLEELGYHYCYDEALNEAYSIGREGNVINRIKTIMNTRKYGKTIKLNSAYDIKIIDDLAMQISDEINLESKNGQFNFNDGRISLTDDVVGRKVNVELLKKLIEENIDNLDNIQIPVEEIQPNIKKEELSRINGVIGKFSTSFKTSSAARKENIRIAAKSLDGKLLLPGEIVSFNETTGPRTVAKGYKAANIIVNGEFIPGVGGGVCQMSTTLYNAVIRADLTIVERSPHSIPSTYVPFGQDAAVSYGYLDLKFKNDFEFPIYIHTLTKRNQVFVYIYGDMNTKNYNVNIDSEIVETIKPKEEIIEDKTLDPGQRAIYQSGRTGYKVKTYKSIVKNGRVVKKSLLNSDFYKPRKFIYKVGPDLPNDVENTEQELEE